MKTVAKPLLERLRMWAAMLCIALTFGLGVTMAQANASVISHISAGDRQLSDGGWACNCEHSDNCVAHEQGEDDDHGRDSVERQHHHHAEAPSSTLPAQVLTDAPLRNLSASTKPRPGLTPDGVDPSRADQPPKL